MTKYRIKKFQAEPPTQDQIRPSDALGQKDWEERLAAFLAREGTTSHQLDALDRLLSKPPLRQSIKPLLPIYEAKERLGYMKALEKHWKQRFERLTGQPKSEFRPLSQIAIATFMTMDIQQLRHAVREVDPKKDALPRDTLLRRVEEMPYFIKIMMTRALDAEERKTKNDAKGKGKRKNERSGDSYDDKLSKDEVARKEKEKKQRARLDDHRCIVLRTVNGEVCHIVPFSSASKEENRAMMEKRIELVSPILFPSTQRGADDEFNDDESDDDDEDPVDTKEDFPAANHKAAFDCSISQADLIAMFTSKVGISDKAWNMITLNRQLHKWWSLGYFAFLPLGIDWSSMCEDDNFENDDEDEDTPSQVNPRSASTKRKKTIVHVKMQFHWMVRREELGSKASLLTVHKDCQSPKALESLLGKTYGDLDSSNPIFAADRQHSLCHYLRTGGVFYAKVEAKRAKHMIQALKLQWAAIKILSIAGGAEALEDVGDQSEYLDENLDWISPRIFSQNDFKKHFTEEVW